MHSNLFRRRVDQRQAGGRSTRGQQLAGRLDQQRQAGRRLGDGPGVEFRGGCVIVTAGGEHRHTTGRPGCRGELVGAQVVQPRCLKITASVSPNSDHELAPPAARCAVEYRCPTIRDRGHQDICTSSVLVDLARTS